MVLFYFINQDRNGLLFKFCWLIYIHSDSMLDMIDFALKKKNGWTLDEIKGWFSKNTIVESFEKRDDYGFWQASYLITQLSEKCKITIDKHI